MSWLDIEVLAVPDDCRHTAKELAALGTACDLTATALVRHGHLHDADFSGLAADAFVRRTTGLAARADALTDRARAVSRALYSYADGVAAVQVLMHRARAVAEPHLVTSATQIFSPGSTSAGPTLPLDAARLAAQRDAWRQAVHLWRDARALEDRTESDLRVALAATPLPSSSPPAHHHVPDVHHHQSPHEGPPPVVEPPATVPPTDPPTPHRHAHHHEEPHAHGEPWHPQEHAHGEPWHPHHHAHAELWTPPHDEGHEVIHPPPICHTVPFLPPHPHHPPIPQPDPVRDPSASTPEEPDVVR
jgi:hypothetical protein